MPTTTTHPPTHTHTTPLISSDGEIEGMAEAGLHSFQGNAPTGRRQQGVIEEAPSSGVDDKECGGGACHEGSRDGTKQACQWYAGVKHAW